MTLSYRAYRDPLEQLLEREARTCKGCAFAVKVFDRDTCSKGKKHGTRCRQYIEREGNTMLQRAKKPEPANWRQQDGVELCLDLWGWWMTLNDRDLGVKGGSRADSESDAAAVKRDIEIAEATDAMMQGMRPIHLWAFKKKFGLARVWNYPHADLAVVYEEAVAILEPKLKKNLATRTLFG